MKFLNKTNILIILIFLLSLIFLGCPSNETEDNIAAKKAGDISITDFQNVKYNKIAASDIGKEISETSDFENNSSGTSDSPDDKCIDELLNSKLLENDENGSYKITIDGEDLSTCFNENNNKDPNLQATFHSFLFSISMEKLKMVDANGNIVNANGKTIGDVRDTYIIQSITKMVMYSDISMTGTINGVTYNSSGHGDMKSMQSSDVDPTKPCTWNNYTFTQDCVFYEYSNYTFSSGGQSENTLKLKKLVFKNGLNESKSGLYYTNGTIDFIINNWSGSMSYSGEPSQNPKYTTTNGTDTINGTYPLVPLSSSISAFIKQSVRRMKIGN